MYYHPYALPNITPEQALNMCRAIADVWFDGIERHRTVQADAARDLCRQDAAARGPTRPEPQGR